jgi:hypothetical protein
MDSYRLSNPMTAFDPTPPRMPTGVPESGHSQMMVESVSAPLSAIQSPLSQTPHARKG